MGTMGHPLNYIQELHTVCDGEGMLSLSGLEIPTFLAKIVQKCDIHIFFSDSVEFMVLDACITLHITCIRPSVNVTCKL